MTDYEQKVKALLSASTVSTAWGELMLDAAAAIEELQAKVDRLTKENRELAADRPEMEEVNGHWEWRKPNGEVLLPKRGEWIRIDKHTIQCPLCHRYLDLRGVNAGRGDANYCPNCGAKMGVQE